MSWEEQANAFRQQQIADNTRQIADTLYREENRRIHNSLNSGSSDVRINTSAKGVTGKYYMSFGKKLFLFLKWESMIAIPVSLFAIIVSLSILSNISALSSSSLVSGVEDYFLLSLALGVIIWIAIDIKIIQKLKYK
ncbi:MAG: hypothetical protein IKK09_01240 [Clostridia bacterium]|nr:hypothetical protein [Clostridia bacterium]